MSVEVIKQEQEENAKVEQGIQQWLQEKLQSQNPNISNVRLSGFSKPLAGASNETLLFDAFYQENDEEKTMPLVARLQPSGPSIFMEYDLGLQYKAMELLKETELLVPNLIGYEENSELLGTPFYLMERISGDVIAENPPYYMEGWYTEISDTDRTAIWNNGIKTVAKVNRQDWKALGFDFLSPKNDETCLQQLLEEYRVYLDWVEAKKRPYPALRAIHQWLLDNQPTDEPTALIWGDAKSGNVLIKDNEITAVLDWEMVRLGNPVHDLAWWITLDNSMSEGLERLVGMEVPKLPGIPNLEETKALWEKESGFSTKDFDYYEVCCAFEFGTIMASLSVNYEKQGLVPPEMEMDINHTCTPLLDRLMKTHNIVAK